ncbi:MAG: serine/threonine-protein kinase [Pseudomonadota bacterium]
MSEHETLCPNCEKKGGGVAEACSNAVCVKKGYHFIPEAHFHRERARTSKPGTREDPEIGRIVERYLIVEKLGEGGMGAVYLALQLPVKKQVALKMVLGLTLDEQAKKRFEREATAITSLYHPNIVSLVDYGINGETGAPFMAIEFVKGGRELSDLMLEKRGSGEAWTNDELSSIFSQVLNGLSVAHKSGLVHRDIKPQNIMLVNVEGNPHFVYLLDFGLAKAIEEMPGVETLTAQGAVLGTPQYMAPEQVASREEIDHRCDLYAVGAILYEMLTGRATCPGRTTNEIFYKKLSPNFDPMSTLPPGILPGPLEALLKKALARNPADRFQSAGEMKEALVEALGGEPGRLSAPLPREQELISNAPTLASDSRRELDGGAPGRLPRVPGASDATIAAEAGVTRDARSVRTSASQVLEKKRSPVLWVGLGIAVAAVLFLVFLFGQWSRQAGAPGAADAGKAAAGKGDAPEPEKQDKVLQKKVHEVIHAPDEPAGDPAKDSEKEPEKAGEAAEAEDIKVEVFKKPKKKPVPKKAVLPEEPSEEVATGVRRKLMQGIKKCSAGETGNYKAEVTFVGHSGKVIGTLTEGSLNQGATNKCMTALINSLTVPPFSKQYFWVKIKYNTEDQPADAPPEPAQP